MAKYHFVFKHKQTDYSSYGITLESPTLLGAVILFNTGYPNEVFLAVYDLEVVSMLLNHQVEFAEKFKNPQLIHETVSKETEEEEDF